MNVQRHISSWIISICFVILVSLSSCNKDGCNVIPDVTVMERVSLIEYPELRIPHRSVAINRGGVAGIIVVNLGNNRYIAFDRCSTVNPENRCAVEVDGQLIGTDPCTNATYILTNGSPSDIAECPLKTYYARLHGETIQIVN